MPIKIDFVSNATGFLRGTKDVEGALDDVADSLDDVTRDGDRSLDKLERSLDSVGDQAKDTSRKVGDLGDDAKDAGRDIERAGEDSEKSFRDVARAAKDAGRDVGDAGTDGKLGMAKIGEGAKEVQQELGQNMAETVSSFRGNLSDLGQIGQDTIGGLAGTVAGLGPAGIAGAAGLGAAAAGVGALTGWFEKLKEKADEAKQAAFEMAYDVAGALEGAGYTERVAEWTSSTEKLKDTQDLATASGWDQVDVIDALASGGDKLDRLKAAVDGTSASMEGGAFRALELQNIMKGVQDGYLSGSDAADLAAAANYRYADSAGKATGDTDDLGNAIYKLPDGKEMVVDVKTKRAYEDLDAIEERKIRSKTVKLNVDDSAVRNWHAPLQIGQTTLSVNPVLQDFNFGRYIP